MIQDYLLVMQYTLSIPMVHPIYEEDSYRYRRPSVLAVVRPNNLVVCEKKFFQELEKYERLKYTVCKLTQSKYLTKDEVADAMEKLKLFEPNGGRSIYMPAIYLGERMGMC